MNCSLRFGTWSTTLSGFASRRTLGGRLKLRNRIYKAFQNRYGLVSCFPYSVAEVAWSIVRKHKRWQRKPYARRLMLKMDASNFSLNYSVLSLSFRKGERMFVPLRYGEYQRSSIVIAFSKEIPLAGPSRRVGYDLNEKSIVGSDGIRYDLSEVA